MNINLCAFDPSLLQLMGRVVCTSQFFRNVLFQFSSCASVIDNSLYKAPAVNSCAFVVMYMWPRFLVSLVKILCYMRQVW